MRIKLLRVMAGPEAVNQIGSIVDVDEYTARQLVLAGGAELVDADKPKPEPTEETTAAARPKAERAVKPRRGRK